MLDSNDQQIKAVKIMKTVFMLSWLLAIAFILVMATKPETLQLNISNADKYLHVAAFAALMFLPALTFDRLRNVAIAAAALLAFGISIEIIQSYLPTRSPELMDIVSDALGVMMGGGLGFALRNLYQSCLPRAYVEAYVAPHKS